MSFLELFVQYEDRWNFPSYIQTMKKSFKKKETTEKIHCIMGDPSDIEISREINPNIAFPYEKGIYEFYPNFSLIEKIEENIHIQIALSLRQAKNNKYDAYVRKLEVPMYVKYILDSNTINLWVTDIVLLVPNKKSNLKIENLTEKSEKSFLTNLLQGLPYKEGIVKYNEKELTELTLDTWNQPIDTRNVELNNSYEPGTRLLFGLFLSLEPELSSNLGSPSILMYKEWERRLRPKLPILSDILDYSLNNIDYTNLNSKPYWIFPTGSDGHATAILVVTKSKYILPGCYYINTGEGVDNHKNIDKKYFNVAAWHKTDNPEETVKKWIVGASHMEERSFDRAYYGEGQIQVYNFLDKREIENSKTFLKLPERKEGEILEWINWKVEDNTLYSTAQTKGTCTFQCILQALFLISLDLDIYDKFVSTLREIRKDFVEKEILDHRVDNFWIIHSINTIYNTHHTLPFPSKIETSGSNEKISYRPRDIPYHGDIAFLRKIESNMTSYESFLSFMKNEVKENLWKKGGNQFKLSELVINKLIPILKDMKEASISDEDWVIWNNYLVSYPPGDVLSDYSMIAIAYVAHILNEKSVNKWNVSEEFRDIYMTKDRYDSKSSCRSGWGPEIGSYLNVVEPFDIGSEDYIWIIFWFNLPIGVPHNQDSNKKECRDFLVGDDYEFQSIDKFLKDIYQFNQKFYRKRMWEAVGNNIVSVTKNRGDEFTYFVENKGYRGYEDVISIFRATYDMGDFFLGYVELINEIPIYSSLDKTLTSLKSSSNVMKKIIQKGWFSYKLSLNKYRDDKIGDNSELRKLWYDKFTFLSPYLHELVDSSISPAFIVLVIVITMSTSGSRLEELRSRFKGKIQPIEFKGKMEIYEEVTLWLYHELFQLPWKGPSNEALSSGTFPISQDVKSDNGDNIDKIKSTLSRCLEYVMDVERYSDILAKMVTRYPENMSIGPSYDFYNENTKRFRLEKFILLDGENLYSSIEDKYLNTLYQTNRYYNAMFLFENSLYFPQHDIRIIKRDKYIFRIKNEEYELVTEDNRFTRWITPSGLNFIIKKGHSYLLYTIFNQLDNSSYSKSIFADISYIGGDINSYNTSSKSTLSVATFHPSGLFFLNCTVTHLLQLCILSIINRWPTLMYIVPLVATYSPSISKEKDMQLFDIIKKYFSNHTVDASYNNYWSDYLNSDVEKGWVYRKTYRYHLDYKQLSNEKYEVDFGYMREFHSNPDWKLYQEKFLKLYRETEIILEKHLNNFQPLFRISSSSEVLMLLHKLSLLYRFLETPDYSPDSLTSLYSQASGYYGIRRLSFILQEIRSCYLISWDQYKLYVSLSDPRIVQQAVMGIGKSSTIIPLLIMKNGPGKLNVIQSSHLVSQSMVSLPSIFIFYNISESFWGHEKYPNSKVSVNISDDTYIKKSILENPLQFRENSFIMDEFDSMYNPLTSEFNIPVEYISHPLAEKLPLNKIHLYPKQKIYLLDKNNSWLSNVQDEKNIELKADKPFEVVSAKETDFISRYMKYLASLISGKEIDMNLSPELKEKLQKDVKSTISNAVYLKDYGFDFNTGSLLAVPYRSLNTPATGSEFSDVDMVIITTLLSLKYSGLQKQHYDALLNSELLSEDQVLMVREGKVSDKMKDILIEKILPMSIKYSREKYNVSFIDLLDENFASSARYAFSGTLNLRLPGVESKCPEYYFKGTQAWQGVNENQSQDERVAEIIEKSEVFRIKDKNDIYSTYRERGFNCLIDPAVVFRDEKNIDVAERLVQGTEKRGVYFHPISDIPMVKDESFNTTICQKQEGLCHFYYDQKHCVGIDAKQPKNMLGLCTVSDINTLTEISQAIFRMRKILFGTHMVIFAYVGKNNISNGKDLMELLLSNEKKDLESKSKNQILQELNVCRRHNKDYVKESYKVTNHYAPLDGEYRKWISKEYKKEFGLTGLKNIDFNDINMSTQQQLQQQQQQQQERELSIAMNLSNFRICVDRDLKFNSPEFEKYWRCEYLRKIVLSVSIGDFYTSSLVKNSEHKDGKFDSPFKTREYELCQILVREDKVFVMTANEMLHMRPNIRTMLRDIKENDSTDLKMRYYAVKFIFGHRVTSQEQFIAFPFVKQNTDFIKQTIFASFTKLGLMIPSSWLKYYIFDMNFLNTDKGKYMLKDLSPDQLEVIYGKEKLKEFSLVKKGDVWKMM